MNRLQLVSRTALECASGASFTTTVSQSGENLLFVNWVDAAWNEMQTAHADWEWLRSSNVLGLGASFATVAGQASYPLGSGAGTCGVTAALFGKWDERTFRNYTTTVGTSDEIEMPPVRYDYWRNVYMLGANRSVQTRPDVVAIGPDKSVCIGPPSDGLYTVTADYFLAPSAMTADTDEPTGLPAQFHMAIVYSAMMMYAAYEAAPEVMQRGMAGYKRLLNQLEGLQAQRISMGGPLA